MVQLVGFFRGVSPFVLSILMIERGDWFQVIRRGFCKPMFWRVECNRVEFVTIHEVGCRVSAQRASLRSSRSHGTYRVSDFAQMRVHNCARITYNVRVGAGVTRSDGEGLNGISKVIGEVSSYHVRARD